MYRPAWKKPSTSLPSDRIKLQVNKSKGKAKESNAEPRKSKEVRKLEGILQEVKTGSGLEKDPKGGCYCLVRVHDLSTYTPICRSCGLILCSINLPYYCCPDCLCPLMTAISRDSLISKLESEVASTIRKEFKDKERAEEDARRTAGAFPALPSSSAPTNKPPSAEKTPRSIQTHKVMSLGSNTKRVLVASYTSKPPPINSTRETVDEEPERILPPAPPPLTDRKPTPNRPFENFIHGSVTYQPKPAASDAHTASKYNRHKKSE